MYYMKWFKSATDKYDEPRMKLLRSLENGNISALILDMLYTLAARCNADGVITFNGLPYTAEMLGCVFGFDEDTMYGALEMLEKCEFISRDSNGGAIMMLDWQKMQCDAWMDDITMKALKQEKKEKKQKKEKKELKQKQEPKQKPKQEQEQEREAAEAASDCTEVQSLYSSICRSFPKIEFLSNKHKHDIKRLCATLTADKIKLCFEMAEESEFLKGKGWATFDWLIKPENAIKVLNGNYRNNAEAETDNGLMSSFCTDEFIEAALSKGFDEFA